MSDEVESALLETLRTNPHDFTSWEALMQLSETKVAKALAEAPKKKMRLDSMPEPLRNAILAAKKVFDDFLTRFPYCFGYWKKYAEFEMIHEGNEMAYEVYEKSIVSFPHSVDLWIQYCTFKSKVCKDGEDAREGQVAIGLDYAAHTFHDAYLEWEENRAIEQNSYSRPLTLLDRIIRIPMQQHQRYYERYQQIANVRPARELVSNDEYQDLKKKVIQAMKARDVKNIRDDAVEAEIKQIVLSDRAAIYAVTERESKKRWHFEEGIKRPYFHVKALDEGQLSNWRRYLEFEEQNGTPIRVIALYERCVVACCLYEEFWIRYARYCLSLNDTERASKIYEKAFSVFIPESNSGIFVEYVRFKEMNEGEQAARTLFHYYLQQRPGQFEALAEYANFEKRTNNVEAAVQFLGTWADSVDSRSRTLMYAHIAKTIDIDIDTARQWWDRGIQQGFLNEKLYMVSYIDFELKYAKSIETCISVVGHLLTTVHPVPLKKKLLARLMDHMYFLGGSVGQLFPFEIECEKQIRSKMEEDQEDPIKGN